MSRRHAAPAVLLVAAFALGGCVILPPFGPAGPGDEPVPAPTRIPGETLIPEDPDACTDTLRLDQPGEYRIGDCDALEIAGRDIEVIAGELGTLTIRGDSNEVDAGSVGAIRIEGQENEVDATVIGMLDIAGDRNDVDSAGDIGAITVAGNDNEVGWRGQAGSVDDRGTGNEIRQEQ